ncbi:fibroblast growth factor receptor-like 1 [Watersipora subatra]|uniref:fibroblast growth factor receptor-like 1 n=1 Tax=Watersipora subatra TaxID=2589382 RepID=UPI00355BAE57
MIVGYLRCHLGQLVALLLVLHTSECSQEKRPSIIQKRVGENVTMRCPQTKPNKLIQWEKDSSPVFDYEAIQIRQNGELRISSVQLLDQGLWSCRWVGGFGSQPWTNFSLFVYNEDISTFPANPVLPTRTAEPSRAPRFIEDPPGQREIEFAEGTSPKLRCRADAVPQAEIDWTKDGHYINYDRENIVKEGFSIKFLNVMSENEGRYTCRVYNAFGEISFTYTLTVTDPNLPTAKVIPPYPLNTSVNYGSTASLECKVRSNSRPTIMWLKQTYSAQYSVEIHNKKYNIIKNETMRVKDEGIYLNVLRIPSVRMDDAGVYVCLGINTGGGSDKREAVLTVINGPTMATTIPLPVTTDDSWEYIFGSPSATLAVLIAIPVIIILIVTIAIIYGLNKRKKMKRGIRRPPSNMSDHEVAAPLNMNVNNGCYSGQHAGAGTGSFNKILPPSNEPRYMDKGYQPPSYRSNTPQQYAQYFQSDGSYRSSLHQPQQAHHHQQSYLQDIPDSDSHFSSVSHTRPQYMNNSRNPYDDRDIHSDPAASRTGGHHCPPPPPSSYYSEQW